MTASTTSATAAAGRPLPKAAEAEHRWVEVRGIRLHVAEYGAGAPVLLLHGFPQHWFAWDRVAVLSGAGRRLICPDLRGFGWSEQTRRGYDIDGLAEDMLALLDALGLDRVGLVGHDWGAHVGFRLCLRAPERFSGFLALNMAHPWARQRAILPNLWRQWYTAFVEYPVIGRAVLRHWPAFSRFLLRHQVADPSVWQADELTEFSAAAQAGAHAGQAMFWQYVVREIPALLRGTWRGRRLTVPTLLLGGERDNVIPPSMLAGGESHACERSSFGAGCVAGRRSTAPWPRAWAPTGGRRSALRRPPDCAAVGRSPASCSGRSPAGHAAWRG